MKGLKISRHIPDADFSVYETFLKKIKPDVVHIHTLMGIHKEFFDVTKN